MKILREHLDHHKALTQFHSDAWILFYNLATLFQRRHMRTGSTSHLEAAILFSREAFRTASSNSKPEAGLGLGFNLKKRYDIDHDPAILEELTVLHAQICNSVPTGDLALVRIQDCLARAFGERYSETGNPNDLERSVQFHSEAFCSETSTLPCLLGTETYLGQHVGSLYRAKYSWGGAIGDLDKAITLLRRCIANPPADRGTHARNMCDLAAMICIRYKRTKRMSDLEKCLRLGRQALDIVPPDDPEKTTILSHVACAIDHKYWKTRAIEDNDEAIALRRAGLDSCPEDISLLTNQAIRLGAKYEVDQDIFYLNETIAHEQRGIVQIRQDLHEWATVAVNLAFHLARHHRRFRRVAELEEAKSLCQMVLEHPTAHQPQVIGATKILLSLAVSHSRPDRGYEAAKRTIDLIPKWATRSLGRHDKQYMTSQIAELACDGAAEALGAQLPVIAALDLLEQGRGVRRIACRVPGRYYSAENGAF
ncbi:hypothetical protein BDW74DRAFT_183595 [Aspergillus multicolor]|uniref:uncharacterized protein n=1 Tax=Aspergillus multicolor TaxID=41759 RepID=UPI003CCD5E41